MACRQKVEAKTEKGRAARRGKLQQEKEGKKL